MHEVRRDLTKLKPINSKNNQVTGPDQAEAKARKSHSRENRETRGRFTTHRQQARMEVCTGHHQKMCYFQTIVHRSSNWAIEDKSYCWFRNAKQQPPHRRTGQRHGGVQEGKYRTCYNQSKWRTYWGKANRGGKKKQDIASNQPYTFSALLSRNNHEGKSIRKRSFKLLLYLCQWTLLCLNSMKWWSLA